MKPRFIKMSLLRSYIYMITKIIIIIMHPHIAAVIILLLHILHTTKSTIINDRPVQSILMNTKD